MCLARQFCVMEIYGFKGEFVSHKYLFVLGDEYMPLEADLCHERLSSPWEANLCLKR